MVPRRSRTKAEDKTEQYRISETKVLQLQIITVKENVVESIINNYYWGKLIEKLMKSNTKIESLKKNSHLATVNR